MHSDRMDADPAGAAQRPAIAWVLPLPHLCFAGFLLYTVVRSVLALTGVRPAGSGEAGLDRASVAVIPIGLCVSAGMLATAIGLLLRRRTAFYLSGAFSFLGGSAGAVLFARGQTLGGVLLIAAGLLGAAHALSWPYYRDAPAEEDDAADED